MDYLTICFVGSYRFLDVGKIQPKSLSITSWSWVPNVPYGCIKLVNENGNSLLYCFLYLCNWGYKFVSFGSYHLLIDAYLQFNKVHVRQLLTWLSINQNSLWCRITLSLEKNLSVVVKLFLCHFPGCPVIHDPRDVYEDLININSRGLVPWNDFDFATGFIKWSQLFLALLKAYGVC